MSKRVRTRYAPSPTGHLHIGGARTALFSFLYARKNQGDFIIRIEDTDTERNVEGAAEKQMNMLKWLGLRWDESVDVGGPFAPYSSMERTDTYNKYIDQLLEEGKAYYSYSTPEELEKEREEQLARGEAPKYSGWDRNLTIEQREELEAEGRVPSVRFWVPEGKTISWIDEVRGEVRFDSDGIGDFVIRRPDGRPTYNLAVVIDDVLMEITHVIRGEEHISNTPRQLLLYEALAFNKPVFAHIPLILNAEGKKMSKRDEGIVQFIDQYKELGYLPEAIVNFIVLLGWSPEGEKEIFSVEELCDTFSLQRVSKSPAVFDPGKLRWMNNHYLKSVSLEEVVNAAIPYLKKVGYITDQISTEKKDWITRLIALYQEQMNHISHIVELTEMFFASEVAYTVEANEILCEDQAIHVCASFLEQIENIADWQPEELKRAIQSVQKKTGCKGKQLFMPIRAGVTGVTHGPDLKESIYLLGAQAVKTRLRRLVGVKESPTTQ